MIDFEVDRIVTEMPGVSRSTVEWIAIKKYRESKKMLLVYVSGVSFYALPRRALERKNTPISLAFSKGSFDQESKGQWRSCG